MEILTISAVAHQMGIQPSAIRYYESIGLLPAPRRISGRRSYDATVLQRLTLIRRAQQAGFTIAEIQTLWVGFAPETPASERWQTLAQTKLAEVDALIRHAQEMKRLLEESILQCRCLTFEECATLIQASDALGSSAHHA